MSGNKKLGLAFDEWGRAVEELDRALSRMVTATTAVRHAIAQNGQQIASAEAVPAPACGGAAPPLAPLPAPCLAVQARAQVEVLEWLKSEIIEMPGQPKAPGCINRNEILGFVCDKIDELQEQAKR